MELIFRLSMLAEMTLPHNQKLVFGLRFVGGPLTAAIICPSNLCLVNSFLVEFSGAFEMVCLKI